MNYKPNTNISVEKWTKTFFYRLIYRFRSFCLIVVLMGFSLRLCSSSKVSERRGKLKYSKSNKKEHKSILSKKTGISATQKIANHVAENISEELADKYFDEGYNTYQKAIQENNKEKFGILTQEAVTKLTKASCLYERLKSDPKKKGKTQHFFSGALLLQDRYEESINAASKAIQYYEWLEKQGNQKYTLEIAHTQNFMGMAYQKLKIYLLAEGRYLSAIEMYRTIGDMVNMAKCHGALGDTFVERAKSEPNKFDYNKAIPEYAKSANLFAQSKNGFPYAVQAYNKVSETFILQAERWHSILINKVENRRVIEEKMLNCYRNAVSGYHNLGSNMYNRGDYQNATKYFEKNLGILIKKLRNPEDSTLTQYNLVCCYRFFDDGKALFYLQLTRRGYEKNARRYASKGKYREASEWIKKTMNIYTTIPDNCIGKEHKLARLRSKLALYHQKVGEYTEAFDMFENIKRFYKGKKLLSERKRRLVATCNYYQGEGWLKRYKYAKAIPYFRVASDIFRTIKTGNKAYEQCAKNDQNLGMCYYLIQEYDEAVKVFKYVYRMLPLYLPKDDIELKLMQKFLCELLVLSENYEEALPELELAEKNLSALKDRFPLGLGKVNQLKGVCYCSMNEYEMSITYLQKAKSFYKGFPNVALVLSETNSYLGRCFFFLKRYKESEESYQEVITVLDALNGVDLSQYFALLQKTYVDLGILHYEQDNVELSESYLQEAYDLAQGYGVGQDNLCFQQTCKYLNVIRSL